jgi:3-hydroxyacyl-CoA dehydrogenase / enoyl-CoA hydratase / 3-hydroxybutyryl-CoA epimerase
MTTTEIPAVKLVSHAEPHTSSEAQFVPELIRRHVTCDHVCILSFDRPNSSANVFDKATLLELNNHLTYILRNSALRGVVLTSAKKSIFVAGADLTQLAKSTTPDELKELVELGQSVFNRLAHVSVPTIAAIHGACLGGGFELCLACDYRIASSDKVTKIGLPETQLGIVPAWGGSTRLPRLIGLPKALDIILGGKVLATKPALNAGMIDAVVPREYILEKACRLVLEKPAEFGLRRQSWFQRLLTSGVAIKIISQQARRQTLRKTRGHYPAIPKAIEVITKGFRKSIEDSLVLERDAILELGQSEACRNLLRIFFLQERAKKLYVDATRDDGVEPVSRVAVFGGGVMGAAIAQWTSSRNIEVVLRDINHEALARAQTSISKLYDQGVKRYTFTKVEARSGMDRICPCVNDVPLQNTGIVIEAAVEKMAVKKQIFARLDELAGPRTILASNTSALSISEIAADTKHPEHPERVIGLHFFNPVHRMQLVEVVVGKQTHPEVVRRGVRFVQQIGKLPVVVKDSPGFLVNRILIPYLMEAGSLFECGAKVEDIDECMLDFGMPMGPLRLIDEVGIDVCNDVAADLASKFSDRMKAPETLQNMLSDGWLGKKSDKGFYCHSKNSREPNVNPKIDRYQRNATCANLTRDALRDRMVLLMVNESARCLESGIVESPADVDFGMIMGTGFAPFVGGPLRFADHVGVVKLVSKMKQIAQAGELQFAPCKLMESLAAVDATFYEK